jgi:preprotein translocase subunit YajC
MIHTLIPVIAEAESTEKGSAGGQGADQVQSMIWLFPILVLLLWLIVLRPANRRQEAERKAMLGSMKKGDKVLTHSGIYGTVVSVADNEDEVTVKVDDNVRLRMTKGSIARNFRAEDEAKAAKQKPKEGAA